MTRSTLRLTVALAVVLIIGITLGITTYLKPKADEVVSQPCLIDRTVSVLADRREATVTPSQTGRFKFMITPGTAEVTPIEFDVSGTASRGDYTVTPENAQDLNFDIAPATGSFKVRSSTFYAIIAIANIQQYIDKTVTVTLRSKSGIVIGSANTATVRLYNPDPGKPSIVVDSPLDNAHFTSSPNLQVNLGAHVFVPTNTTGSQSVTFYVDGTAYPATTSGQNATYTLNNPSVGRHTVRAQLTAGQRVVNNDDQPIPPGQTTIDFIVEPAPPSPSPSLTPTPGGTPNSVPVRPGAFLLPLHDYFAPKALAQTTQERVLCGTVVDSVTRAPLSGVHVRYEANKFYQDILETETDTSGRFLFRNVPAWRADEIERRTAGSYWFKVLLPEIDTRNGYPAVIYKSQTDVAAAPQGTNIRIDRQKGGKITGTVRDDAGQLIRNGTVQISANNVPYGEVEIANDGTYTSTYLPTNIALDVVACSRPFASNGCSQSIQPKPYANIVPTVVNIVVDRLWRIRATIVGREVTDWNNVIVKATDESSGVVRQLKKSEGESFPGEYEFRFNTAEANASYSIQAFRYHRNGTVALQSTNRVIHVSPGRPSPAEVQLTWKDTMSASLQYETIPYMLPGCTIRSKFDDCRGVALGEFLTKKVAPNVADLRRRMGAPAGAAITIETIKFYPPSTSIGEPVVIFDERDQEVDRQTTILTDERDTEPYGRAKLLPSLDPQRYRVSITPNEPLVFCLKMLFKKGSTNQIRYVRVSSEGKIVGTINYPSETDYVFDSWGRTPYGSSPNYGFLDLNKTTTAPPTTTSCL